MSKEDETTVVLVAAVTEPLAVELIEESLPEHMHLRPLWERLSVVQTDEFTAIGLPITNKVTKDTIDNHRRHLFSLFNLLGVPLVRSYLHLQQVEVDKEFVREVQLPEGVQPSIRPKTD